MLIRATLDMNQLIYNTQHGNIYRHYIWFSCLNKESPTATKRTLAALFLSRGDQVIPNCYCLETLAL